MRQISHDARWSLRSNCRCTRRLRARHNVAYRPLRYSDLEDPLRIAGQMAVRLPTTVMKHINGRSRRLLRKASVSSACCAANVVNYVERKPYAVLHERTSATRIHISISCSPGVRTGASISVTGSPSYSRRVDCIHRYQRQTRTIGPSCLAID